MDIDVEQINAATGYVISAERAVRYGHGITPINHDESRHRFLAGWNAGRPENPQLEYPATPVHASQAIDKAWMALPADGRWRGVLARELGRAAAGLRALTTRDPVQHAAYSRLQFGVPDAADLADAERYLQAHPADPVETVPTVGADAVVAAVRAVVAEAGLAGWTVEATAHMVSRMGVVGSRRLVRVRRDTKFVPAEVRRLMIHELGAHVVRAANGQQQRLRILGYGITGYMATEEGLAVWHEQQSGVADVGVMRRYALRVIASHTALTDDFCAVFGILRQYTSPDEAFTMALRVKRGLLDTGAPGGYIKDHIYLTGARTMRTFLDRHPDDHELLLATKWPLTEIQTLRRWHRAGIVREPVYRPSALTDLIDNAVAELP